MQRKRRLLFFALAILVGVAAGLVYGWLINPVSYADTGMDKLRSDYKTDYVLMVAEVFHTERDLSRAIAHLTLLGTEKPAVYVNEAILFAGNHGYAPADINLMLYLAQSLEVLN